MRGSPAHRQVQSGRGHAGSMEARRKCENDLWWHNLMPAIQPVGNVDSQRERFATWIEHIQFQCRISVPIPDWRLKTGARILCPGRSPDPQRCGAMSRPCRRLINGSFIRRPRCAVPSGVQKTPAAENPDVADRNRAVHRPATSSPRPANRQ